MPLVDSYAFRTAPLDIERTPGGARGPCKLAAHLVTYEGTALRNTTGSVPRATLYDFSVSRGTNSN